MMLIPSCDIDWRCYVAQTQATLNEDAQSLSSNAARRSYAELLSGVFSDDDAAFVLLYDRIAEIGNLQEDWDSYGAASPTSESVAIARAAIDRLRISQLLPETVAPSAEGGLSIYFSKGSQKAFIECLNDGDLLLALYAKDDDPNVRVLPNGLEDLNDQALQEIRYHLGARA